MIKNLSPINITNMPDLVRLVESMKTPKQKLTLMRNGEVVATLTKEADLSVSRKQLEILCLGRDIHSEAPPKTEWTFTDDNYAAVPVTLSYQGRSMIDGYYLSDSSDIPTPVEMLERLIDEVYDMERFTEDELFGRKKRQMERIKAVDTKLRQVLGTDYEAFKQAGKPYRYY